MTQAEILEALKQMTTEERLEIIEAASRIMRQEIEEKALAKAEMKQKLAAAAEAATSYYQPGGALADLWSPDSEDYYDSEDEYLGNRVETNA